MLSFKIKFETEFEFEAECVQIFSMTVQMCVVDIFDYYAIQYLKLHYSRLKE